MCDQPSLSPITPHHQSSHQTDCEGLGRSRRVAGHAQVITRSHLEVGAVRTELEGKRCYRGPRMTLTIFELEDPFADSVIEQRYCAERIVQEVQKGPPATVDVTQRL